MTPILTNRVVVILLSGGIDSTVAATLKAFELKNIVYLLTVRYGQGAEIAENVQSRAVADWLLAKFENVVEHFELELSGKTRSSKSRVQRTGLNDLDLSPVSNSGFVGWRHPTGGWPQAGYPSTRDEAFTLLAAAGAEARLRDLPLAQEGEVVLATNSDDLANFTDIRIDNYNIHLNAILAKKLIPQSGRPVRIDLPLIHLTKAEIIRRGANIGAPLHLTWSCYFGEPGAPCRTCDQCRWRARAFHVAGIMDPAHAELGTRSVA